MLVGRAAVGDCGSGERRHRGPARTGAARHNSVLGTHIPPAPAPTLPRLTLNIPAILNRLLQSDIPAIENKKSIFIVLNYQQCSAVQDKESSAPKV